MNGCIMARTKRQMTATTISVKHYLRKYMLKPNRLQADDKLKELLDHFAFLNQCEHLKNLKTEGKDRHNAKTTISQVHNNRSPRRNKANWQNTKGQMKDQHTNAYLRNFNMRRSGCIIRKPDRLCYY